MRVREGTRDNRDLAVRRLRKINKVWNATLTERASTAKIGRSLSSKIITWIIGTKTKIVLSPFDTATPCLTYIAHFTVHISSSLPLQRRLRRRFAQAACKGKRVHGSAQACLISAISAEATEIEYVLDTKTYSDGPLFVKKSIRFRQEFASLSSIRDSRNKISSRFCQSIEHRKIAERARHHPQPHDRTWTK